MMRCFEYASMIENDEILAGLEIKLMIERFRSFLANPDYIYRPDKAFKPVQWIEKNLRHFKGRKAGEAFILERWQVFIVSNLFGFYVFDKDLGEERRLFDTGYIEVGRKNGKTVLGAALAIYCMIADGEEGAESIIAANSFKQAKIAFQYINKFAKQLDPKKKGKKKKIEILTDSLRHLKSNSTCDAIPASPDRLDGYNCHFALIDEAHAAPDTKVWDVIESSTGSRTQPIILTITTSGLDKSLPCYDMRTAYISVLKGLKTADNIFIAIYCIDENDNWKEPRTCAEKANPNIGVSVYWSKIIKAVEKVAITPSSEQECLVKHFNFWSDSEDVWISTNHIYDCTVDKMKIQDYCEDLDYELYIGCDLAITKDLTAIIFMFKHYEKNEFVFFSRFYIPRWTVNESSMKHLFDKWERNGEITVTPGNITDYDYLLRDIYKIANMKQVEMIGYDRYNATELMKTLTQDGFNCMPVSQLNSSLNAPTKYLEYAMLSDNCEVKLENSELFRFCFQNAQLHSDRYGNVRPIKPDNKKNTNKKIDGVMGSLNALWCYMNDNKEDFPEFNVIGVST